MNRSPMRDSEWLELSRIARVELMLTKMGDILAGLDIPVTDWLWENLHLMEDHNTEALARWEETFYGAGSDSAPGAEPPKDTDGKEKATRQ